MGGPETVSVAQCPNLNLFGMSGISVSREQVQRAIMLAAADHMQKDEVSAFVAPGAIEANTDRLYNALADDTYKDLLTYRQLTKTNLNGKVRRIDSPDYITRVFQWLFLLVVRPLYEAKETGFAYNCKEGYGITAKDPDKSLLHAVKRLFYDERHLHYAVVADQRRCYEFVTVRTFRRELKHLTRDRWFLDFAVAVCFVRGQLPVGTPSSPMAHHIVMLRFDKFAASLGYHVRYADDNAIGVETIEEAQRVKWRVRNFWWYEYRIRAKRQTVRVMSLDDEPLDFCGYKVRRGGSGRGKGFTKVRQSTVNRAKRSTRRNWGCYYGILKHADCYDLMRKIENRMKLQQLTEKIRINRALDAPNIPMKDLVGLTFNVYEYDMRKDGQGQYNWIKCLIGIPLEDGRVAAREFHGNYSGIIAFIAECEKRFGKAALLPLEDVEIENQCGYIFKDSTNQLKYITNE